MIGKSGKYYRAGILPGRRVTGQAGNQRRLGMPILRK